MPSVAAKSVPFFAYGCCVPTYEGIWLLMVLFSLFFLVVACFWCAAMAVRWMYKRRLRKECNAIRDKQKKIEENKLGMNIKIRDIAAGASKKKEFERNTRKLRNLTNELITIRENSKSLISSGMSLCSSMAGPMQSSQQGALPPVSQVDPTISNREADVFTNATSIQTTLASCSGISGTMDTKTGATGASGTTLENKKDTITKMTETSAVTVSQEQTNGSNFPMDDSVFAGVVHIMAKYGGKQQLEQKEIRNGPPILYSKNERRMYPQDDFSSFKDGGSGENHVQSDKLSTENTVSPLIMSNKKVPESTKENEKLKRKKSIYGSPSGKKQRSVTVNSEEDENRDYRPVISDKEVGSTFPYYTEARIKESRNKSIPNRSSLEVRKADERMAKSTAMDRGSRTSPTSNSTVSSWVPNVYDLRREADRQRAEMETENARTLLEERQKRMIIGAQSSNVFSSSARPAASASQMLQKDGERVYKTSRAAIISPYDIRINMDDSNSQRAFSK